MHHEQGTFDGWVTTQSFSRLICINFSLFGQVMVKMHSKNTQKLLFVHSINNREKKSAVWKCLYHEEYETKYIVKKK